MALLRDLTGQVTSLAREAGYAAVGFGVLGLRRVIVEQDRLRRGSAPAARTTAAPGQHAPRPGDFRLSDVRLGGLRLDRLADLRLAELLVDRLADLRTVDVALRELVTGDRIEGLVDQATRIVDAVRLEDLVDQATRIVDAVRLEELADRATRIVDGAGGFEDLVDQATRIVDAAFQPVEDQLPPPARELAQMAHDQVRELGTQLRQLFRSPS